MATLASRLSSVITAIGNDIKSLRIAVNYSTQTGTTYTIVMADAGTVVELSNAAAITLTIPNNTTTAFPSGTIIEILQAGAGQVTISPAAGVTIDSRGSAFKTAGQWALAYMYKRNPNEWVLTGDVTT